MDLRLYAVTDKGQNERCGRSNAEVIEAAIRGGATFIQLREKDAPGGVMLAEAQASLAVCRKHGVSPCLPFSPLSDSQLRIFSPGHMIG